MRRSRFRTNLLQALAGFLKPRVAESGVAAQEARDARAIGPPNAIDPVQMGNPGAESMTHQEALKITALAVNLLFVNGQTTERTVVAAERLGHFLGISVKVLPYWDELMVQVDGAPVE